VTRTRGAVNALLEEGIDRGFFPGAAALVLEDGAPLVELYLGSAQVEPQSEKSDVSAETLWDLASLTKPLAGAATLLALAEARALSLDDPLSRFHDLYRKTKFDGVTLRGLLAHRAGVQAWYPLYVRGEGREAYRKTLADMDPAAPPGAETIYSCLGYLLLADVAERALGGELDVFFRDRFAARLGLAKDLLFSPDGADRVRAAGGERDDATERRMVAERRLRYFGFREGVVNGEANDGNAYRRAAGVSLNAGLFGTARAVGAMGRAWLERDARLLSESSVDEAFRGELGWRAEEGGFSHTGFTGGFLFLHPESRRVLVLLANHLHPDARAGDMDDVRRRFREAALAIS
jgi:CubicO group peptidase (beta-lactamase class C family)